jgi:hypothetical protein
VNFDKVLPELKPFGGKVLKTSLTNVEEERLRKALEGLNTGGVKVNEASLSSRAVIVAASHRTYFTASAYLSPNRH